MESLHAVGTVFAAMTRASGMVPQISVVLGAAAGGAAYGPALTDIVILSDHGRIFVTGPDVVRSVTGEDVDMARLGGPEPHSRRSGRGSPGGRHRRGRARPGPAARGAARRAGPVDVDRSAARTGRAGPAAARVARAAPTTCTR